MPLSVRRKEWGPYRNQERKRLATPRLCRTQHITTLQRERDGLLLDVCQRLEMRRVQARRRLLCQWQFRELCRLQILSPISRLPLALLLLHLWVGGGGRGYKHTNSETLLSSSASSSSSRLRFRPFVFAGFLNFGAPFSGTRTDGISVLLLIFLLLFPQCLKCDRKNLGVCSGIGLADLRERRSG